SLSLISSLIIKSCFAIIKHLQNKAQIRKLTSPYFHADDCFAPPMKKRNAKAFRTYFPIRTMFSSKISPKSGCPFACVGEGEKRKPSALPNHITTGFFLCQELFETFLQQF
ncbi:MAG: hypothetical protein J6A56_02640, partial [Clostridia bacterium]|nr:hypothetical protein [Clostridia bacterium]